MAAHNTEIFKAHTTLNPVWFGVLKRTPPDSFDSDPMNKSITVLGLAPFVTLLSAILHACHYPSVFLLDSFWSEETSFKDKALVLCTEYIKCVTFLRTTRRGGCRTLERKTNNGQHRSENNKLLQPARDSSGGGETAQR